MRLDALLLQAIDDIGGDAGIDRGLDRGRVALVDEHGDRPLTARLIWNICSSTSRLGFSRSIRMTSGSIA